MLVHPSTTTINPKLRLRAAARPADGFSRDRPGSNAWAGAFVADVAGASAEAVAVDVASTAADGTKSSMILGGLCSSGVVERLTGRCCCFTAVLLLLMWRLQ